MKSVFRAGMNVHTVNAKNKRQIKKTPSGLWKNESADLKNGFTELSVRLSAGILSGMFSFICLPRAEIRQALWRRQFMGTNEAQNLTRANPAKRGSAKNVRGLAILFRKSSLTEGGAALECRLGYLNIYSF
jgi:hypothetical protein